MSPRRFPSIASALVAAAGLTEGTTPDGLCLRGDCAIDHAKEQPGGVAPAPMGNEGKEPHR